MDIMTPMPEIVEKENSMRQALTTPPTQNFDASKVAKKMPSASASEEPIVEQAVKKKKPRGMSAMSPEKKAAHMEKMRIASANARKKRADAKNQPTTENDPLPPVPREAIPEVKEPTPTPSAVPQPTPTPVVSTPASAPAPTPSASASAVHHRQHPADARLGTDMRQEIDYNRLAETMERRKAEGNRRVVTKEEINFFEQTVRANERKKTLADLEKEQEKAIQDFMTKRTRKRTMPKADKSYAIWDNW